MSTRYIRAPRLNQHVLLTPIATVRDETISYRALGVLSRLLSNADGFGQSAEDLASGEGREGRDAIRSALRELRAARYIVRRPRVGADGRFLGVEMYVFDTPQEPCEEHRTPENPLAGFPRAENQAHKSSTEKDIKSEKSSSTRALARARPPAGAGASAKAEKVQQKKALRIVHGIHCWDALDVRTAEALVATHGLEAVERAVASLLSHGRTLLPSTVAVELQRLASEALEASRTRGAAERLAVLEAASRRRAEAEMAEMLGTATPCGRGG
ncbi:MAG: hypothetical protein ACYCT1_14350 [Steroidobacteraceae bacterium]|jgi:hypothetical protein